MAKRGRTSRAELELTAVPPPSAAPRVAPRADCPAHIAALFIELAASVPDDHWRPADSFLLEQYAQAVHLARQAFEALDNEGTVNEAGRASPWLIVLEKAHRSSVALSMRLRLSPQSRLDPKTVARADPNRGKAKPWA